MTTDPSHPSPTELGGYELRRVIGRGAAGVVWEAWDPRLDRRAAIKLVQLAGKSEEERDDLRARFRQEAQITARLHHPGIVRVFGYDDTADGAFLVMELVDGETLYSALERGEKLSVARIVDILSDVLLTLDHCHHLGVAHRDIKPSNLMLTTDGTTKVADFGVARPEASELTMAGTMIGTAPYMSPEQYTARHPADARSDIWACGVVLYELLTGQRPFRGDMATVMNQVLSLVPSPPSRLNPGVPVAFDAVVARALAKEPDQRFPTAAAFAIALRAALPPMPRNSDHSGPPRGRRWAGVGAGAAVLVLGLGAWLWWPEPPHPIAPIPPRPPSTQAVLVPPAPPPPAETQPVPPAPAPVETATTIPPAPAPPIPAPPEPTPAPAAPPEPAAPQQESSTPPPAAPLVIPEPEQLPQAAFRLTQESDVTIAPSPPAPSVTAPAVEPVAPPPPAFDLVEARRLATALPCAVLDVSDMTAPTGPMRLSLTGLATRDAAWEELLRNLRGPDRVVEDTTQPLDQVHCPIVAVIAEPIRRNREQGIVRLLATDTLVPVSGKLAARARAAPGGALLADLYGPDGSVRHLVPRQVTPGGDITFDGPVPAPPGPRLLVVIVTPAPFASPARPPNETTAAYLPALQRDLAGLPSGGKPIVAETALIAVIAPLPAPAPEPRPTARPTPPPAQAPAAARAPRLNNAHCADIVARVQLGGALSDEDRTALRTSCRP